MTVLLALFFISPPVPRLHEGIQFTVTHSSTRERSKTSGRSSLWQREAPFKFTPRRRALFSDFHSNCVKRQKRKPADLALFFSVRARGLFFPLLTVDDKKKEDGTKRTTGRVRQSSSIGMGKTRGLCLNCVRAWREEKL